MTQADFTLRHHKVDGEFCIVMAWSISMSLIWAHLMPQCIVQYGGFSAKLSLVCTSSPLCFAIKRAHHNVSQIGNI